jgi:hypothetical protein
MNKQNMPIIIGVVAIVLVLVIGGAIGAVMLMQRNGSEQIQTIENQTPPQTEPAPDTMVEDDMADPPITQAQLPGVDTDEPDVLPTEPPPPQTAEDLDQELEYLDELIDTTSDDAFTEETLEIQ